MAKIEFFVPDTQSTFLLSQVAHEREPRQNRDFRKSCRPLFAKIGSDWLIFFVSLNEMVVNSVGLGRPIPKDGK